MRRCGQLCNCTFLLLLMQSCRASWMPDPCLSLHRSSLSPCYLPNTWRHPLPIPGVEAAPCNVDTGRRRPRGSDAQSRLLSACPTAGFRTPSLPTGRTCTSPTTRAIDAEQEWYACLHLHSGHRRRCHAQTPAPLADAWRQCKCDNKPWILLTFHIGMLSLL